jgi:hypothetical protein
MTNWITDNFGRKNFFILALVILGIAGIVKGPSWYKQITGNRYQGVVEAKVTNIEPRKTSFQHFNGTTTKTVGFTITYEYQVEKKTYSGSEYIATDSDISLIFEQFNSGKECRIEIKYANDKPSESTVSKLLPAR